MDYTNEVPPYDSQYSATTHSDMQDCVEESLCHIVYMMTGKRYSPRALAYLTQVTPNGSSVEEAIKTANHYGFIPYELWPTPDSFTWESYYADIPAEVLAQADHYDISLISADLDKSPLWTELIFNPNASIPGPLHMVAQINETQYFDSETGAPIKPLNYEGAKIGWQSSIQLTPKNMNSRVKIINYKGTIYYAVGVADKSELPAFNAVFDANVESNPDGSIPADITVQ
jgi:hypothetical protein